MGPLGTDLIEFHVFSRPALSVIPMMDCSFPLLVSESGMTLVGEDYFVPMVNSIRIQVVRVEEG
jgi:hypothetical protein